MKINDEKLQKYVAGELSAEEAAQVRREFDNNYLKEQAGLYEEIFDDLNTPVDFELSHDFTKNVMRQTHPQKLVGLQRYLVLGFAALFVFILGFNALWYFYDYQQVVTAVQKVTDPQIEALQTLSTAPSTISKISSYDFTLLLGAVTILMLLAGLDRVFVKKRFSQ